MLPIRITWPMARLHPGQKRDISRMGLWHQYFKCPQIIPTCNQIERTTALNTCLWLECRLCEEKQRTNKSGKEVLAQILKCYHLCSTYLLNTYRVLGTLLGARDILGNNTRVPILLEFTIKLCWRMFRTIHILCLTHYSIWWFVFRRNLVLNAQNSKFDV